MDRTGNAYDRAFKEINNIQYFTLIIIGIISKTASFSISYMQKCA